MDDIAIINAFNEQLRSLDNEMGLTSKANYAERHRTEPLHHTDRFVKLYALKRGSGRFG